MRELHPLLDLLLAHWATDSGLEPDLVRSYVTDELPWPHDLAHEIARVLGITVSSLGRVSPPLAIKPLGSTIASPTRANAVPRMARPSHGLSPMPSANKTGKPFSHRSSLTAWLDSNGKSAAWLADQLAVKRQTLAAWMSGANAWPALMVDRVKKLTAASVGDDAFAKVRAG